MVTKNQKNLTYKRRKCYSSCTRARVVFWRFRSPAVVNKKIDPYGASRGWAPGISKKYYIKIQIFIILMPGRSSRGQFLHTVHVLRFGVKFIKVGKFYLGFVKIPRFFPKILGWLPRLRRVKKHPLRRRFQNSIFRDFHMAIFHFLLYFHCDFYYFYF